MEYLVFALTGLLVVVGNSLPAQACQNKQTALGTSLVDVYQPQVKSQGAIIIAPPTGGSNFLDRRYAKALCRAGFTALILRQWEGMEEEAIELEVHRRLLSRAQIAFSEVVDKFSSQGFLGVLGTSVGAIHGLTALGTLPIDAGFFIAPGAPVSQVIAESDQSELARYREKRFQHYQFKSRDEYKRALAQVIPQNLEPLNFSEVLKAKPTGFILANHDKTVPTHLQQNVVDHIEPEISLEMNANHFWTIIKSWWFYEGVIVDFFLKSSGSHE